jgi:hypothetical protein
MDQWDTYLLQSDEQDFKYDKVEFVMIGLGIIHLFFVTITAILVIKVYKLVKFRDLPILLSIFSVFLSLLSKIYDLLSFSNACLGDYVFLFHPCG